MSICLYFHPDCYTTEGRQIVGRHVAGESFLSSYLTYGSSRNLWIQVESDEHARAFGHFASKCLRKDPIRVIKRCNISQLKKPGCVFLPGPNLAEWANHRTIYGDNRWSLCGITHTTASDLAMDAISGLLLSPVQSWDALICTSSAVHNNVSRILEAQGEYLSQRFRCQRFPLPELPIIPLGVNSSAFQSSEVMRKDAIQKLGIPHDSLVVLYVGRLAFHSKANPLAMYRALEVAAKHVKKQVIVLECGWHANNNIRDDFSKAASLLCPTVEVRNLDGRQPAQIALAWQVADVFCSLADNVQETFGLTPVEAMAAGIPVVVSDWDGYRDTVRNGLDGFRIPTVAPSPGCGAYLAERYALGLDSYDRYCGYTSSLISVDVREAAKAFMKLFTSSELRKKMGNSGRMHVTHKFDWRVIIPKYEELWNEMTLRRKSSHETTTSLKQPWAARMDPFYAFQAYPTTQLLPKTKVALMENSFEKSLKLFCSYKGLAMVDFARELMIPDNEIEKLLGILINGPLSVESLFKFLDTTHFSSDKFLRSISWLMKLGVIENVAIPIVKDKND